jgi:hypothetical protein
MVVATPAPPGLAGGGHVLWVTVPRRLEARLVGCRITAVACRHAAWM